MTDCFWYFVLMLLAGLVMTLCFAFAMVSHPLKKIRRWKCRRDFSRLDEDHQKIITYIGDDPESLIKRGKL